jgi:hypothetical protein
MGLGKVVLMASASTGNSYTIPPAWSGLSLEDGSLSLSYAKVRAVTGFALCVMDKSLAEGQTNCLPGKHRMAGPPTPIPPGFPAGPRPALGKGLARSCSNAIYFCGYHHCPGGGFLANSGFCLSLKNRGWPHNRSEDFNA